MNVYEIVTERILTLLAQGTAPWRKPWSAGSSEPMNLVSGKPYRGINVLLTGSQGYASPFWATYKQIQTKGGQVRKGEKATPVVFWKTGKDEKTEKDYFVLRYYSVFNVAQCEGLDLPAAPTERVYEPIAACEALAKGYPGGPQVEHGGERACYIPLTDTVHMPRMGAFDCREEYYAALFHELTHSTGAVHRLDRGLDTTFGTHAYSFEELVAEIGASFLCARAGIDGAIIDNAAAYLAGWHKKLKSEPKWMVLAAGKAAKAPDLISNVKVEKESEEVAA